MKAIKSKEVLKSKQEAVKSDMQKRVDQLEQRFQEELSEDYNEFFTFIVEKRKTWDSDFLKGMQERLEKKQPLSDNMKKALRGMQERDRQYAASKVMREEQKDVPKFKMTVLVKKWWVQQNGLVNFVYTFDVYAETAKAYKVKGTADAVERSYCTFCGKTLTELASQIVGCGSTCAEKNGVPYPADVLSMNKKERATLRKEIQTIVRGVKFEGWLPKSQVKEVLEQSN